VVLVSQKQKTAGERYIQQEGPTQAQNERGRKTPNRGSFFNVEYQKKTAIKKKDKKEFISAKKQPKQRTTKG